MRRAGNTQREARTSCGWLVLLVAASSCGRTLAYPEVLPCVFDVDCPEGLRCLNQQCVPQSALDAGALGKVFGESCVKETDCQSGRCVAGPGGAFCTLACEGACPGAFVCKWLGAPDSEAGVCALPQPMLCQPCAADLDCGASGADQCLLLGTGRFCGQDCTFTGCPEGYACADAGSARQCLPVGSGCDCGPQTQGLTRGCARSSGAGSCHGAQRCEDAGWSACNARLARPEACNGLDDDCNGLVDDALPPRPCTRTVAGRTCAGKEVCEGASGPRCDAPVPAAESCDYQDNDCNGKIDEPFVDSQGRYGVAAAHCGGCGVDCQKLLPWATSSRCRIEPSGVPGCAAAACETGYYPADSGACLPLLDRLCEPCLTSADCDGPGSACLELDGQRVCARSCAIGSPYPACPPGYSCTAVAAGMQCLPTSGSCSCKASYLGTQRSCRRLTCSGYQVCGLDGGAAQWSACDLAPYNPEICDGVDNDCDGIVDNGYRNPVTGKYDSAQSCGFCNNDCSKIWSPSLQHTSGVCDASLALPVCRMGPCTTEVVGSARYEWVNVNGEDDDGCECRRVLGNASTDLPDLEPSAAGSYLDENCDGVDGVVADALFVWALAPAGGNGSLTSPFRTLGAALAAFGPSGKRYVLVAEGSYRENVLLATGVQLFGGYSASFTRRDPRLYRSVVVGQPRSGSSSGPMAAIHAQGISALAPRTIVSGFIIEGLEVATVPANDADGASTYALYIRDCGPGLVIANNDIIAGRAGRGGRGSDGVQGNGSQLSAALHGDPGLDGGRTTGPCTGPWRPGGDGGVNSQCPSANAMPGGGVGCPQYNWATKQGGQSQYVSTDGGNGQGGFDMSFGPTSGTGCGMVTTSGSPNSIQPKDGRDGKAGADGVAGVGGLGAPGLARFGTIALGEWRPAPTTASPGVAGAAAQAGGGGGAGAGTAYYPDGGCTSYEYGATAGGGGAGGCGGGEGKAGRSGGASIAVLAVFAAPVAPAQAPQLSDNRISRNFGGQGGAGGFGGAGGLGGTGGLGGLSTTWSGSVGGQGGKGGNGGAGGAGGGGAGGPSYGILCLDFEASAWGTQNVFTVAATSNTGGQGGPGGSSPGPTATGTPGTAGAFADLLSLVRCSPGCPAGQSCDPNGVCLPN